MSFDIPQMHFPDNSYEAQVIEAIINRDHVTPEEAIRRALRGVASTQKSPALSGLGLFSSPEDAAAIDAAVTLAYEERHKPSRRSIGP